MILSSAKPFEEVLDMLKGEDDIFIIGCSVCAAKIHVGGEPEVLQMKRLLEEKGKRVSGWAVANAACSMSSFDVLVEKTPAIRDAKAILVMACGSGVSAVSAVAVQPVYPSNNTDSLGGRIPGALINDMCAMCGDCIVHHFGGICPRGKCPKRLLNGPCGGSMDGKCEVDPEKDCAWRLIHKRLERLGRLDQLERIWE